MASQLHAVASGDPYQAPEVRARRSATRRPSALTPLDPARLSGVDAYETTDESFSWTPLEILAPRVED